MSVQNESHENLPQVIYVSGYGRSGSTLLDIILGNHSKFVSTGELSNLVSFGILGDHLINHSGRFSENNFWVEVLTDLKDRLSSIDWEYISHLESKYCTFTVRNYVLSFYPSGRRRELVDFYSEIFVSINRVSACDFIVDSSKSPIRLNLLKSSKKISIFNIFLVKDLRGICASLSRKWKKDMARGIPYDIPAVTPKSTIVKWFLINIATIFAAKQISKRRRCQLSYESLVRDPKEIAEELTGQLSTPLDCEFNNALENNKFEVSATIVSGNRLRMQPFVEVQVSSIESVEFSLPDRILIGLASVSVQAFSRFSA